TRPRSRRCSSIRWSGRIRWRSRSWTTTSQRTPSSCPICTRNATDLDSFQASGDVLVRAFPGDAATGTFSSSEQEPIDTHVVRSSTRPRFVARRNVRPRFVWTLVVGLLVAAIFVWVSSRHVEEPCQYPGSFVMNGHCVPNPGAPGQVYGGT